MAINSRPVRSATGPIATMDLRALRAGMTGAILTFAGFVLLPSFRAVIEAILGSAPARTYPRPSEIPQEEWWGISGAAIFALIGIGVLLMAVSFPTGAVTRALGVIGAGGFLLSGAGARAMYSFVAANLTRTGADVGAQTAALWAVNIVSGVFLILAGCATAAWALLLGMHGPRTGLIGQATAVMLILCAAVILLGEIGLVLLPVQLAFLPVCATLALSLGRRMRKTAADG